MSSLQSPGLDSPAWLERRLALSQRLAVARGEQPADLVLAGGRVPDLFTGAVEEVDVAIHQSLVVDLANAYLCPGFIEGHLHVESTLLARAVNPQDTKAVVADYHEIANVMGLEVIQAMLEDSEDLPVTFYFNAPFCVPATPLEDAKLLQAAEKLARGMWLMIRQGTSAHNLADLLPLVTLFSERRCLLVSDDRHPDTLAYEGLLDDLLRLAVAPGYAADLVILEDLQGFRVRQVSKSGRLLAQEGQCLHPCVTTFPEGARGRLSCGPLSLDTFRVPAGGPRAWVIGLVPGQIFTEHLIEDTPARDGWRTADASRGLARLTVIERHQASGRVGQGLVKGLGLRGCALASSVSHDSHNLVVAGMDEESMLTAACRVAKLGGGLCAALDTKVLAELPLPLAGLMSAQPLEQVLGQLEDLRQGADLICVHPETFMPLSLVSLPVVPHFKLTDRGLMDVDAFAPVELFPA